MFPYLVHDAKLLAYQLIYVPTLTDGHDHNQGLGSRGPELFIWRCITCAPRPVEKPALLKRLDPRVAIKSKSEILKTVKSFILCVFTLLQE